MKRLTDKQIKTYLMYLKGNNKRLKNKAKSRLRKDFNKFSFIRIEELRIKLNKFEDEVKKN